MTTTPADLGAIDLDAIRNYRGVDQVFFAAAICDLIAAVEALRARAAELEIGLPALAKWQRDDAERVQLLKAREVELAGALEGVMPWMTGECSRTVPDEWVRAAAALAATPAKALERARAVEAVFVAARAILVETNSPRARTLRAKLDALGKEKEVS